MHFTIDSLRLLRSILVALFGFYEDTAIRHTLLELTYHSTVSLLNVTPSAHYRINCNSRVNGYRGRFGRPPADKIPSLFRSYHKSEAPQPIPNRFPGFFQKESVAAIPQKEHRLNFSFLRMRAISVSKLRLNAKIFPPNLRPYNSKSRSANKKVL